MFFNKLRKYRFGDIYKIGYEYFMVVANYRVGEYSVCDCCKRGIFKPVFQEIEIFNGKFSNLKQERICGLSEVREEYHIKYEKDRYVGNVFDDLLKEEKKRW
jgi:hypothetical protein